MLVVVFLCRLSESWTNEEGIVYLGEYPARYTSCRLSRNRQYLAGASRDKPTLQLSRIADNKLEFLGEILFPGIGYQYICNRSLESSRRISGLLEQNNLFRSFLFIMVV